jgi:hypothetical protein
MSWTFTITNICGSPAKLYRMCNGGEIYRQDTWEGLRAHIAEDYKAQAGMIESLAGRSMIVMNWDHYQKSIGF